MINIPPILVDTPLRTELVPDIAKIWKVGQVLNATTARNANANDLVLIRMGQTVLEAKTPIALKAGDRLGLVVKSLGETPVLIIQTSRAPQQVAAQNLKSFIAQQQDLTALLAFSQSVISSPSISRLLKQHLGHLTQELPDAAEVVQAATLKKLVQNSGVFLESNLKGRLTDSLEEDIKSQLLRINTLLQEAAPGLLANSQSAAIDNLRAAIDSLLKGEISLLQFSVVLSNSLSADELRLLRRTLAVADNVALPGHLTGTLGMLLKHIKLQPNVRELQRNLLELLEMMGVLRQLRFHTEGALAKITSQQLIPLTREDDKFVLFDLYFKDQNEYRMLNFRLGQEHSADSQTTPGWRITLDFEFSELGPVQVQLHLTDNNIHALFLAEYESTAGRILRHSNLLEAAFNKIGFDAIGVRVTQGDISPRNDLAADIQIVDEKA